MDRAYAAADLVFMPGGASTLFELMAMGKTRDPGALSLRGQ